MAVLLGNRTEVSVRRYYEKSQQAEIKAMLPQKAQSVEEAIADYKETLLPGAASYGRTICVDDLYIGDVWCYCIDMTETPNAMLSFCIFEKSYWNNGITTEAVALFLKEIREKYGLDTVGAFTFSENIASQRVLEKNEFQLVEEFEEEGIASKYYQKTLR